MCAGVWFNDQYAHNITDLTILIGRENLVFNDGSGFDDFSADSCLCVVNHRDTAANLLCRVINYDPFDLEYKYVGKRGLRPRATLPER